MEIYKQENPLFDLLYLLRGGKPQQNNLLNLIFQNFDQDPKLASKLSRIVMEYQDCNPTNQITPLQVAVQYNQIKAIRFAQSDGRFDLTDEKLIQIAVTNCNFALIEILQFDEGQSVVMAKKSNSQSATNLKILKKYERYELLRMVSESQDLEEESQTNSVPQFPIQKIPEKCFTENVSEMLSSCSIRSLVIPITQEIQKINLDKCNPNLLRCEMYVEQILRNVFNFQQPQLDFLILSLLNKSDVPIKTLAELLTLTNCIIPQKPIFKTFDKYQIIDKYCNQFAKSLIVWINDYKQQLNTKESNFDQLRRVLTYKLACDITYQGPNSEFLHSFQEQLTIYRMIFTQLKKPRININSSLFLLEQYEQLHQVERNQTLASNTYISVQTYDYNL